MEQRGKGIACRDLRLLPILHSYPPKFTSPSYSSHCHVLRQSGKERFSGWKGTLINPKRLPLSLYYVNRWCARIADLSYVDSIYVKKKRFYQTSFCSKIPPERVAG